MKMINGKSFMEWLDQYMWAEGRQKREAEEALDRFYNEDVGNEQEELNHAA